MFPLLAIGAALTSAAVVAANTSSDTQIKNKTTRREELPAAAARPQSYIVTPVFADGSQGPQSPTVADLIGRFIV